MPRSAMLVTAIAALVLMLGGCTEGSRREKAQCPQIRQYSDAELTAIQKSIDALPPDDPLRGAMRDYEDLRDDARVCDALAKGG